MNQTRPRVPPLAPSSPQDKPQYPRQAYNCPLYHTQHGKKNQRRGKRRGFWAVRTGASYTISRLAHLRKRKRSKTEEGGLLRRARHSRIHRRNRGGACGIREKKGDRYLRIDFPTVLKERASSRADFIARSICEEPSSLTSWNQLVPVQSLIPSWTRIVRNTPRSME